ncbi:MAG: hypothetical protein ACRD0K_20025 [Egibacteraceae bacterium]
MAGREHVGGGEQPGSDREVCGADPARVAAGVLALVVAAASGVSGARAGQRSSARPVQ